MMNCIKKLFLGRHPGISALVVTTVAAFLLSYFYCTRGNPEMVFWAEAARQKIEWRENLAEENQEPVVVVFGGSATGFGIDANYATESLKLPMVNLGFHAGMGAEALTGFALSQVRQGDTLLVMLEPSLLLNDESVTALGVQFAAATGNRDILSWRKDAGAMEALTSFSDLRPGAGNIFSLIGKIVLRKPLYRYQTEDIEEGGLLKTDVRGKFVSGEGPLSGLSENGKSLLGDLAKIATERKFRVYYTLPWEYVEPSDTDLVRTRNEKFLSEVEKLVPVLREPQTGIHSVRSDFADLALHLTAEAAVVRTSALAEAFSQLD